MKIKDQVASLSLSRKLKNAGYPQHGLFWWVKGKKKWELHQNWGADDKRVESCVAPTVAELGEMLELDKTEWLVCSKDPISKVFVVNFRHEIIKANTEANARARILIWLAENKYVDFKEK